jgi:hypothetical protein
MTDLVQRLRAAGDDYTIEWGSGALYDAAADEIERLRAERVADEALLRQALEALRMPHDASGPPNAVGDAIDALRERLEKT